ncbi:unnamed protein product [Rotaria sp. Silwood2]|nr:unnamed protein product [Rotaria sp. Silwood2]
MLESSSVYINLKCGWHGISKQGINKTNSDQSKLEEELILLSGPYGDDVAFVKQSNDYILIEFDSLRSGHGLQWWNLLTILEMNSLSFAEESVAILIIHSILQYGPLVSDSSILSDSWCPESHQQFLEDHFVDELISRLSHHIDDCEVNW